jgi:hypothetical protein
MSENQENRLVDPNVPADQGLSALGLLMQLGGSLFAGVGALGLFQFLIIAGRSRGNAGSQLGMLIVLLAACVTRSIFHRQAGVDLLYRRGGLDGSVSPFAGIRRYILVAVIHTALLALLMKAKFHAPGKLVFAYSVGFLTWPAILAVLIQLPRFKRYETELPVSEDKGFEGAAILMTVLGTCGVLAGAIILYFMLDNAEALLKTTEGLILLGAMVMLFIRSVFHLQAGVAGVRETSVDRIVERTNRYANFGIIAAFCAGGAFLLTAMMNKPDPAALALISGICWLLLAWPMIIRRFYSERQFGDLMAGDDASLHRRAPDAGLTSLGWFLLVWAAASASSLIPQVIASGDGGGFGGMAEMMSMMSSRGTGSIWWPVAVIALQAWAGFELIRMSGPSRIIACVYGAFAVFVTLVVQWDMIKHLGKSFDLGGGPGEIFMYGTVAMSLVVPVSTLLLVNRKITPSATARYKPQGAPQG